MSTATPTSLATSRPSLTRPIPAPPQPTPSAAQASRIEELGRIILAYSEITERLRISHEQLQCTVANLQVELSEKNRQLERRNRLAALGEMAAGMAHEIRNPLGGIQLYASLLSKDLVRQPESLKLVGKISTGVKRLEALVSQVLQFTREIAARPEETEIGALVDQAIEYATPALDRTGAKVIVDGARPLHGRVDPLLLGQAVLNLVINAAEAMRESGTIFVRFAAGEEPGRIALTIRDTGPGISADVLDRLFNPFFTTKETGTGLGLAIVHRIVEAHEGTISVTNAPEGGAVFELRM
jgi:signal transduction histidine kinase